MKAFMAALALVLSLAWLDSALAAPQPSYPYATTPLNSSDYLTGVQAGHTANFKVGDLSSTAQTVTGPYPGQVPQALSGSASQGCLSVFTYLSPAQQAAVQNGTSTVDFQPIETAMETALSVNGGSVYSGTNRQCWEPGAYPMGATVNLKHIVEIRGAGASGGLATSAPVGATKWVFPANTPGVIINSNCTFGNATISPCTTGADGSIFEGIWVADAASTWTDPTANPGIWLRARAVLRNNNVSWSAGNCYQIIASAGGGGSIEGNANEWRLDTNNANCPAGGWGFYIQGADVNGGTSIASGVVNAGLGGMADRGFLSSTHIGDHVDAAGALGLGQVTYSGHNFALTSAAAGIGASTTPVIGMQGPWWDLGAGSGYPAWSGAGTYMVSSGFFSDNANNRGVWIGNYVEASAPLSHIGPPAIVIGGSTQTQYTSLTPYCFVASGILSNPYTCRTGIGSFSFLPASLSSIYGTYAYGVVDGLSLVFGDQLGDGFRFGPFNSLKGIIQASDPNSGGTDFSLTSSTSAANFGRTAAVPNVFVAPLNGIACCSYTAALNNARIISNGTSAPSTTGNAVGELFWDTTPTPGTCELWVETAQGTPDTWACIARVAVTDTTVSGLPTCNSTTKGARAFVTDASAATYSVGASVTGSGSAYVPVYCNATSWLAGKNDLAAPDTKPHLFAANDDAPQRKRAA